MITKVAAIKLAVEHGKLKILKDYTPSTDTCNGARVDIEFRTEEWDKLAKTVGFYRGDLAYGQIIQDGETSCIIPWEILNVRQLCDCDFYINVIGTADNGTVLTTNRVHFKMALGGFDELLVSSEPTPTLYEQLRDLMYKFDSSKYVTTEQVVDQINANMPQSDWNQTDKTLADYIKNKPTVDQTYSANSTNAQSGKAVAEAIKDVINSTELNRVVSEALTEAKQNGEFDGKDGKSAYDYALEGGYIGSEEEFYDVLGNATIGSGGESELPSVTTEDNGKVLMVKNGTWEAGELPKYDGGYEVIPSATNDSALKTAQTYVDSDIIIRKIPYYEVSNNSGGNTVYIGSEV